MTDAGLQFIRDAMASGGIPYEFLEYTSPISSLKSYWVGEYSESEHRNEDGGHETQFILTGTSRGSWLDLENQKETIEQIFPANGGKTAILSNGTGIAVFYGNAFPIPTGDGFLKRLQVNLTVKEWRTK